MAEMVYTATMASSAYGTEKDTAGGGLLADDHTLGHLRVDVIDTGEVENIVVAGIDDALVVLPFKVGNIHALGHGEKITQPVIP